MKLNKLFFPTLVSLLVSAFLVFVASNNFVRATDSKSQNTIRVLFIGNSYTFVNNLPQILETLSAHEAKPIEAKTVTEGGATLKKHWRDGKALAAIKQGHWNYVVLQEHSTFGPAPVINNIAQLNDPGDFYTYARLFDAEIKKIGAKTLFYMTWARQNAPQNQAIIARTYTTIADELQDEVVPVGMAWAASLKARPTLALHQSDKSHPDPYGSYLAACVFYAELYHKNPVGLTSHIYESTKLDLDENAAFLQQIAWQVIENIDTAKDAILVTL